MKKKLVVYLAGLLTVLGPGFGQAQFSDVPAGHWAKKAVERIAACGLITGFPDKTFRGNQNLTRYQAAFILHRLLNEIQQGGKCVKGPGQGGGMSEEDMTAIRNAAQELAAELAALGVRVPVLKDNVASRDDIARLEAAIEELKKMKAEPAPSGVDEAALADLTDRVEAASVAADTALVQTQILTERLDGVEGDVAALKTQVEADADSIRALNEMAVLLNQDVLSLQDRVTALEKQLRDVDFESFTNRENINAIQEFATALRADLVRFSDRVSALDTRVSGLDSRLAAVEGARPTLTGSLLGRYGYRFTIGPDFDIDRLFPAAGFAKDSDGADFAVIDPITRLPVPDPSDTLGQADLTFGLRRTPGTGSGFNFSEASVTLRFSAGDGNLQVPDNTISLRGVSVSGNVDGQPVSLRYSTDNTFRFTPYFFNNNATAAGGGFVVSASLTRALLSPNFTIVLGSTATNTSTTDRDYFGIRGAINLLGLNLGVNYAENDLRGTVTDDRIAVVGLDWSGKLLGFLDFEGEFINSNDVVTNTPGSFFYVQAGTSLGPICLRGNYRSINSGFATGNWTDALPGTSLGLSQNDTNRLFDPAHAGAGFGLIASASLGIIGVNGYLDSRVPQLSLAPNTTAVGVGVTLGPIAGFNVTGYLNNASTVGVAQYSVNNAYSNRGPATRAAFGTNLGVRLANDGAPIGSLKLAFELRSSDGANAGFVSNGARTDLVGEASYPINLGFLTFTPNLRIHSYTAATTPGTEVSYSTLKYGVQASIQPLFFGISLNGAFAQRNTDFASGTDASETLIRAGLGFVNFLLPGATLNVDVAQVTGSGVGGYTTRGFNNPFTTINDGLFNGPNGDFGPVAPAIGDGGVRGIQVRYTYAGWGIWYGVFDLDSNATNFSIIESVGRGFRIFYTLNF